MPRPSRNMRSRFNLAKAQAIAETINEKLRPISAASVDLNDPTWMERMRRLRPLDQAGVRPEAESLLRSLLDAYASGSSKRRADIRELFRKNSSFRWAASIPESAATAEGFRLRLLRLSILEGIEDPRDQTLNLQSIMKTAEAAGIKMKPILAEVAAVSESPLREFLSAKR